MTTIKFYGGRWCHDCLTSKKLLDERGIEYEYIDLETVPEAAAIVEEMNNGLQRIPTIVFPNGLTLVEPTNEDLAKALSENNL